MPHRLKHLRSEASDLLTRRQSRTIVKEHVSPQ
jgi:hypothetical protein